MANRNRRSSHAYGGDRWTYLYAPVGHVINLASRMQTVAPASGIVISEDTRRLVEGYFELAVWG
jgi:class 3 adenylate cyclase